MYVCVYVCACLLCVCMFVCVCVSCGYVDIWLGGCVCVCIVMWVFCIGWGKYEYVKFYVCVY